MKISLIIATRNRCQQLGRCLAHVERLHCEYDWELVIVDNGSSDGTAEVVQKFAEQVDFDVKLVHEPRPGLGCAHNAGIASARGELVAFLDADDVWFPKKLELQVEALQAHPDAALCFTDFLEFDESGVTMPSRMNTRVNARGWFERLQVGDTEIACGTMYKELLQANWIHTSSVLIRKATLSEVGLFDGAFAMGEDYDLWLRIAKMYPVVCVNRVLSDYRYQAQSLCGPLKFRRLVHSRGIAQVLEKHLRAKSVPSALLDVAAEKVSQCYSVVGWSLFRQNRLAEARSLFRQGLRYHPSDLLLWLYLCASFLPLTIVEGIRRLRRWVSALQGPAETAPH